MAYGEEVTPERLQMIDKAEQLLRSLGLRTVRVRYHRGDLARLEVPAEAIALLAAPETRARLAAELKQLGFKYVTLDLEGFRSGSQNDVLVGQGTDNSLPIIQDNANPMTNGVRCNLVIGAWSLVIPQSGLTEWTQVSTTFCGVPKIRAKAGSNSSPPRSATISDSNLLLLAIKSFTKP